MARGETGSVRDLRELRRFFQDARYDHEVVHEWFRIEWHKMPDAVLASTLIGAHGVPIIRQHRRVLYRLLDIGVDYADVLAWAFELHDHPPRLRTLVGEYCGVAIRTDAAQQAFRAHCYRSCGYQEHGSHAGIVGFLSELPPSAPTLKAVREETRKRVNLALAAYVATAA